MLFESSSAGNSASKGVENCVPSHAQHKTIFRVIRSHGALMELNLQRRSNDWISYGEKRLHIYVHAYMYHLAFPSDLLYILFIRQPSLRVVHTFNPCSSPVCSGYISSVVNYCGCNSISGASESMVVH